MKPTNIVHRLFSRYGGSQSVSLNGLIAARVGRILSQRHLVNEQTDTITNHVHRIDSLSALLIEHAELREYEMSVVDLDSIESNVNSVRLCIEELRRLRKE